jgi:hypothetical protein
MHKRIIMVLGIFLGSHAPATAQTPAPQILLAQERVAPALTKLQTVSPPLLTISFLLHQDPGGSSTHFSYLLAEPSERGHSLERLLPTEEVKTLFFTRSSLPLLQLWSGRLQLDAFQNTLHTQNVELGPYGYADMQGFRSLRQSYLGGPRSIHLSGFSLSFHLGRDARTRRPTQVWRRLPRIVGTVLN